MRIRLLERIQALNKRKERREGRGAKVRKMLNVLKMRREKKN